MIVDGLKFADYFAPEEFLRRIDRSRGYEAAYRGQPCNAAASEAWRAGWSAAMALGIEYRPSEPTRFIHDIEEPVHAESESADPPAAGPALAHTENRRGDARGGDRLAETADGSVVSDRNVCNPDPAGDANRLVPTHGHQVNQDPIHYGIVCLVDFMNLLVRAFHAGQPSDIHAVRGMLDTVRGIIERLSPEYLIFAVDGGHAERKRLHPGYKSSREKKPPELQAQIELGLQAIDAIGWPSIQVSDWEADDVLASLATRLGPVSAGVLVCSSDKDLLQLYSVPGVSIYHPWDGGKRITRQDVRDKYRVDPEQIADYLALVGDSSDDVPGVTGIGPKTAAELLTEHKDLAGVLEAARVLKIRGAAGKRLVEQRTAAELSRRLVALRADLPVGDAWTAGPASSPRLGYREQLAKLGLGAVAQRLAQVLGPGAPNGHCLRIRIVAPAPGVEWGAVPDNGGGIPDNRGGIPDNREDPSTWPRSLKELEALGPDPDRRHWFRFVYRVEWDHVRAGREVEMGWREGSIEYRVTMAARNGVPFAQVDLTPAAPRPETPAPATSPRVAQRELF